MKRTPALLLLSLCAAALASAATAAAVAAEARQPQPPPQPPSIERRRRPQQRQEMKKLGFLVGTFRGAAAGRPSRPATRRENSWEAGGAFLSLRLRSAGGGQDPSVSLDVVGYDLETETFRATHYSPFSNGKPEVVTCALEGRRLIIPSRHGHSRRTFEESAAGILVRTERKDGGRWVTVAESAFTALR